MWIWTCQFVEILVIICEWEFVGCVCVCMYVCGLIKYYMCEYLYCLCMWVWVVIIGMHVCVSRLCMCHSYVYVCRFYIFLVCVYVCKLCVCRLCVSMCVGYVCMWVFVNLRVCVNLEAHVWMYIWVCEKCNIAFLDVQLDTLFDLNFLASSHVVTPVTSQNVYFKQKETSGETERIIFPKNVIFFFKVFHINLIWTIFISLFFLQFVAEKVFWFRSRRNSLTFFTVNFKWNIFLSAPEICEYMFLFYSCFCFILFFL